MPDETLTMLGIALLAIAGALVRARRLPRRARIVWIIVSGVLGAAAGTLATSGRHRFADPELVPVWQWLRSITFADIARIFDALARHPSWLIASALFLASILIGLRTSLAPLLIEALRRTATSIAVTVALVLAAIVLVIGNSPVNWAEGVWLLLLVLPFAAFVFGAMVFSPVRGIYWRVAGDAIPVRRAPVRTARAEPAVVPSARTHIRDSLQKRDGVDLAVLDQAFTKSWQRESTMAEYGALTPGGLAAILPRAGTAGGPGARQRMTDAMGRAVARQSPAFRRRLQFLRERAVPIALALAGALLALGWLSGR